MNLQVKHPLLAAPAFIGGLELKNKIIMAPMGSNFAGEDGHTTEQLESYYEERAKGGVGLIILETSAITWPAGASNNTSPVPTLASYARWRPARSGF